MVIVVVVVVWFQINSDLFHYMSIAYCCLLGRKEFNVGHSSSCCRGGSNGNRLYNESQAAKVKQLKSKTVHQNSC